MVSRSGDDTIANDNSNEHSKNSDSDRQSTLPSNPQPAGYFPGMRQPSKPFSFQVVLPPNLDLAALDRHLVERFMLVLEPIRTQVICAPGSTDAAALDFTWRAMQLASGLLQAMKIPSFDPGLITGLVAVYEDHQKFSVTCRLPVVDLISADWTVQCMKLAYRLLFRLADASLQEDAITALLDELDAKFIEPATAQIIGGTSTVPLLQAAYRQNVPFRHLGAGLYQLGWGVNARLTERSSCELDSVIGAHSSHNKQTAATLMRAAGVPVPEHRLVPDSAQALDAAHALGFPVVVKPADKDRGEGITVDVADEDSLRAAFDAAAKVSSRVLVERQVTGLCHRVVVVGNEVLYTVARNPKLVDGDGVHTVRQLIDRANAIELRKAVHRRKSPITIDDDVIARLAEQHLDLDAVPAVNHRVLLRKIESSAWGGTPELVTDVHPDNLQIAIRAARLLRLHVAGIDMLSPDIRRPWHENNAAINEVNYAPLIGNYYDYQRDSMDVMIRGLFPHAARVPIEVFIGDTAAVDAAQSRQQVLAAQGVAAYATTHRRSWSVTGDITLALANDNLFIRCVALLMDSSVEALLIVVQTDEFLHTGMPVDHLDRVSVINDALHSHQNTDELASKENRFLLLGQFAQLRRKKSNAVTDPT